jgi:phenylacetate-CoA ligase
VSEVLTPAMRARIEKVFRAPVRDTYACYELGMIAWECPQGGTYHVCDDNVIIEIEGGKDNDSGELIGTNLHFTAMPIIRYQLGDVVTRGPERCACGSPFTTLAAIQGRMNDYFPLPDGRFVHPYRIGTAVWSASFAWMHQYQVVQERRDRVVMRIIARRDPTSDEIAALEKAVTAVFGDDVEFVTELVDDINDEVNGKFRIYRSFVESDYDV